MLSTEGLYLLFFTSGFTVGFGHCIGMCGPIVVSFSLNLSRKNVFFPHFLYNCGRIITYMMLGGIMGATGSFTQVTASIIGIQKAAMIFAGGLIVFMGVAMSGWIPVGAIFTDSHGSGRMVSKAFQKLSNVKSTAAYLPIGLLLGLLPCGPVYTALVAAARAGMEAKYPLEGIFIGAGLMVAFGIGTAPALLIVAKLAGLGWLKSRTIIYKIGAVLMMLGGIYFIIRGIKY
jgi:sulfite exporter TauE/SafE